jgi:hypothetical protein
MQTVIECGVIIKRPREINLSQKPKNTFYAQYSSSISLTVFEKIKEI